jgi:outer membrane protein OmpA-like peptidoglycan-associated protein
MSSFTSRALASDSASRRRRRSRLVAAAAILVSAASAGADEARDDLLTLARGTVVARADVSRARALDLLDGNPSRGWSNERPKDRPPYVFVFELLAPTLLTEVGVDTAGRRPGGAVGAAAKTVEIAASASGPDSGFAVLGTVEVAEDGAASLAVSTAAPVRWLRFTVRDNHGNPNWTYVDELLAFGTQEPVADDDGRYTGRWATNFGPVEIAQRGTELTGCYRDGTLVGSVAGGVARLAWQDRKSPKVHGTALFVIDAAKNLEGVQYRLPSRARWGGKPADATTAKTECGAIAPASNPIAAALAARGAVDVYGIQFDFDSAALLPRSEPVLRQVAAALGEGDAPAVAVSGHTDDVGPDEYNLDLSRRRAEAVVGWLAEHGVPRARLAAVGRGENEPVADNTTADGRALNRRVAIAFAP